MAGKRQTKRRKMQPQNEAKEETGHHPELKEDPEGDQNNAEMDTATHHAFITTDVPVKIKPDPDCDNEDMMMGPAVHASDAVGHLNIKPDPDGDETEHLACAAALSAANESVKQERRSDIPPTNAAETRTGRNRTREAPGPGVSGLEEKPYSVCLPSSAEFAASEDVHGSDGSYTPDEIQRPETATSASQDEDATIENAGGPSKRSAKDVNDILNVISRVTPQRFRKLMCDVCGEYFRHEDHLKVHCETHTNTLALTCSICGKGFETKKSLENHTRSHTKRKTYGRKKDAGEKPFSCDQCGKKYAARSSLSFHKLVHDANTRQQCDVCEAVFGTKRELTRHRRSHTGEKPFRCDVCGKAYASEATLSYHRQVHTGDMRYQCDICEKFFVKESSLDIHSRIHWGDRRYKCKLCNRNFSHAYLLKNHEDHAHVSADDDFEC